MGIANQDEITKVIDEASDNPDKFAGMTYVQGVINALEWVLDNESENPMED